jgi:uncharacterized protein with HEPN domain
MLKRDVFLFVEDILEAIGDIEESLEGLSKNLFKADKDKKDATLRRLEIIGEAVKNLPSWFRENHPDVPWRDIAGFRDVLTHAYFGVDLDRVWLIVKNDLPKLKKQLKSIVDKK